MGRDHYFGGSPRRIVSLVPSDTYSLLALGAGDRVVGRTRYCEEPAATVASIPSVGGTKDPSIDAILELGPDLVIANQEENGRKVLEELATRARVYVSMPRRVADGIGHLAKLARILQVGRGTPGAELVKRGYELVQRAVPDAALPVFVPIWMDPLMTANGDTFGSDVLALAGAQNVFADRLRLYPLAADLGKTTPADATGRDVRYPRITLDEVRGRGAQLVVLPDEPHPFSAEDEATLTAAAGARALRVSGKDLFWSGAWSIEGVPRVAAQIEAARWEIVRDRGPC